MSLIIFFNSIYNVFSTSIKYYKYYEINKKDKQNLKDIFYIKSIIQKNKRGYAF